MPLGPPDPLAVLRGHKGEVQALDFDASERLLVSGDSLGEVWVWDLADLRPAASLRLHPLASGVLALRLFCCAGRRLLATQGRDGTTLLWACSGDGVDLQLSEQPLQTFVRDCYSFCRLSVLAPAEPPLPASSSSQPDPEQQQQEQQRQLAEAFAATVLAGDEPGSSGSNEASAGQPSAAAAAAAAAAVQTAAAAAQAEGASSSGGDGELPQAASAAIWALHPCPTGSPTQPPALLAVPGSDERTAEVLCCACGARVASFSGDAAGRKLGMLMALQLYCAPAPGAAAAAAGPAAAAAAEGEAIAQPAADAADAAAAAAEPAAAVYLAAGYEDGSVAVWDPAAPPGAPPLALRQLCKEPITALAVDSAGSGGAAGSAEQQVAVFRADHAAGRLGVRYAEPLGKKGVGDLAVRPDRRLLAVGAWDGRVRLHKYRSGRQLAVLKYHTAAVTALRFAPRSQLLASAARDGTLALWPVYAQPRE